MPSLCRIGRISNNTLSMLMAALGVFRWCQVCEAMQAVHHAGVVHRGLSAKCVDVYEALDPENPYSVSVKVREARW